MEDTEKYLIHAAITADGVVERSDVVGAIFGQTEGLLGDDLDLRDLQQSSKVGRIDVEIDSQNGQSFGTVTIASTLDRVKTAILAASLETITRVGPCRATVEVTDIEDVREAKRREVVERAKELLSESFDESVMSSSEILDEVKESVRIEDIGEYEGLPAGPRVGESDAVVVVEGRADVLNLLRYGVKNAIGVEGTNVPDAVADLTQERTTTAFLDGDRGGRLILRELTQVGDVDHVAFAPEGRSVEDLDRHEVFAALRNKDPIGAVEVDPSRSADTHDDPEGEPPDPRQGSPTTESAAPRADRLDAQEYEYDAHDGSRAARSDASDTEASTGATPADDDAAATASATADPDGSASAPPASNGTAEAASTGDRGTPETSSPREADDGDVEGGADGTGSDATDGEASPQAADGADSGGDGADSDDAPDADDAPRSLADHVREVIDGDSGTVRLLDDDLATAREAPAADAFDAIDGADPAPYAVVLDGEFTQRLLDIAAQRGVDHAIAATTGEFVKKPVGVRLRTADQLANSVAG
ncbi:DNA primase DnaG [Halobellus ruber]|uniref:DNA primase DnaG n=1 Tax=Halobellus ruber TaxID=2761102 RepID=A0A7J9SLU3_9EURY|nr:DNA primase DnaG [Halobellus ruber]MBB6646977.1 DNA primase [Halobellus ruber]